MATQKTKPYVIVRTISAGVFAGVEVSRNGDSIILNKSRRLWYWMGAASLSQLAVDGVSKPTQCKFPCEVDNHEVRGVIEVLPVTKAARQSIASVPVWKQ